MTRKATSWAGVALLIAVLIPVEGVVQAWQWVKRKIGRSYEQDEHVCSRDAAPR